MLQAVKAIKSAERGGDAEKATVAREWLREACNEFDEIEEEEELVAGVGRDDYEESDDGMDVMDGDHGSEEDEEDDDDKDEGDEDEEDNGKIIPSEPNSFSLLDVETLRKGKNSDIFPNLAAATRVTFGVNSGEMLYLPACMLIFFFMIMHVIYAMCVCVCGFFAL